MNITLIGMAGAGKSTIGKALADKIGYGFVDTDDLLRERFGKELYNVIDEIGDEGFIKAETEIVLSLMSSKDKYIPIPKLHPNHITSFY
ncbi:MAG: (d)CMP kinase [Candidatus Vogelbacteria bacterium]|nr:(d)CMP kinase [Candidatus Vogelbacteria bacterium]